MNIQRGLLKTGGAALAALLLAGAVGAAQAGEGRRGDFDRDGFRAQVQEVRHDHWADRRHHRWDNRRYGHRRDHRFRGGHRYYAPPRFGYRYGHWKRKHHKSRHWKDRHHKPRHWRGRHHKPGHWWVPYGLRH